MKTNYQNPIRKKEGMALVAVLIVLLVFSVLFGGLAYVSTRNMSTTAKAQNFNETYYAAESGINIMVELIQREAQAVYDLKVSNEDFKSTLNNRVLTNISSDSVVFDALNGVYKVAIGDITADVKVVEEIIDDEVTSEYLRVRYGLTSNGYKNTESRELYTNLGVQYFLPKDSPGNEFMLDVALLTFSKITGANGFNVLGAPITSLTDAVPAISWSGGPVPNLRIELPDFDGKCETTKLRVSVQNNAFDPCLATSKYEAEDFVPMIIMPDIPQGAVKLTAADVGGNSSIVNSNGDFMNPSWNAFKLTFPEGNNTFYIPKLEIRQNNDSSRVTFDIGNRDIHVVVDQLILNGNSAFDVKYEEGSEGRLHFYVLNNLEIDGNNTIGNSEDVSKTLIYSYSDNEEINMGNSKKVYLSIMGKDLSVTVGNGAIFRGNLVTGGKSVVFKGGAAGTAQLIYAPNAHVKIENGGSLRGAVIANEFTGSGGGKLTYDASAFVDLPFVITSPVITEPGEGNTTGHIFIINQGAVVEK